MNNRATNKVTIDVAATKPPDAGKKKGKIETRDGKVFWVWPDKLGLLRPGNRYEVEYESSDYNGRTYHTIIKCTPQCAAEPQEQLRQSPGSSATEAYFVARVLAAAIQTGQVPINERSMTKAVHEIRQVWAGSFGSGGPRHA